MNDFFRVTSERKNYGVRLRIRNLTLNDQGSWKCLGLDRDSKSFSSILQINIKGSFLCNEITIIHCLRR